MKKKLLALALAVIASAGAAGAFGGFAIDAYAADEGSAVVSDDNGESEQDIPQAPVLTAVSGVQSVTLGFGRSEGAVRYELFRQSLDDSEDTLVYSSDEVLDAYSFTDTGLMPAVKYTYYAKAVFEDESAVVSDMVSAYAGLGAASATVSEQSEGKIKLSLAEVEGANRYRVYIVDQQTGIKTGLARLVNGKTEYTYTKALGGRNYKFYVIADYVFEDGTVISGKGAYVSCSQPLSAPVFTLTPDADKVTINWGPVSGADYYKIYKYDYTNKKWVGVRTVDGSKTSYTVTGLAATTDYTFVVRSAFMVGSAWFFDKKMADPQTVTTKLATPTFSSLTFKGKTVTAKWKEVSGATGYHIYRYDAAQKKYVLYKGVAAGKSSMSSNSKVELGTKYYYKIRAYKKLDDGSVVYSAFTSAKTVIPKIRIVIDPGHVVGGNYSGNEYDNVVGAYSEARMSTALSHYLRDYLVAYGIEIKLTRETEKAYDLDLNDRGLMAEGYDFFLSLHSNAAGASANKVYAYCCVDGKADAIGAQLSAAIAKTMGVPDGGVAHRYSEDYPGKDYYCVLRNAKSVGVSGILMEHSYHTNYYVRTWLLNQSNLKKLAKAEADVIAKYYGII